MARGKYVQRKVLWVIVSDELTSRGNPEEYEFYMECGHTRGEYHDARSVGNTFMWMESERGNAPALMMGCRDCTAGKALNYFNRIRLGRLPVRALDKHPELRQAWEQVKNLPSPVKGNDIIA